METIIIIVFVLGYLAITLEHNLHIDKLIPALAMMAILWAMIALGHLDVFDIDVTKLPKAAPHSHRRSNTTTWEKQQKYLSSFWVR